MQRSTLAAVRVAAAALLVLGTASVAWGLHARSGYDCESGYVYEADGVQADEIDGTAVPFEDLDPTVREGFLQALDGRGDAEPVSETPPQFVRYRGEQYAVVAAAVDCAEPPGLVRILVGAPLLVSGLFVLLPVSVVLRTRDWEG